MLTAHQLNLRLDLPVSRPLIPMKAAMVLLDRSEDEVLALIDTGELAWAWDIASCHADRREVRIWRESILVCIHSSTHPSIQPATADELVVINSLLPHSGAEIRSTHLQRLFTASQGHIQNLIEQGLLVGLNDARTGPHGYVRVTRVSIIQFFRDRRIL